MNDCNVPNFTNTTVRLRLAAQSAAYFEFLLYYCLFTPVLGRPLSDSTIAITAKQLEKQITKAQQIKACGKRIQT